MANFFSKTDLKTEMTLSLINRFNLTLGGYSIWSASIRRRNSGLEHLIASMQPGKYSEDYSGRSKDFKPEQWIPEALESTRWTSPEVLNACRPRLRRARGLVRPGAAGLLTGVEYSRVGSTAWVRPTSTVTTRTTIELA